MKYAVDREGQAGQSYVEESHILEVNPRRDGEYGAEILLKPKVSYQNDPALEWTGRLYRLKLLPRQVKDLVEQHREENKGEFCEACFDYGKVTTPPPSCTRCLLLDACRRSNMGDFRKGKTPIQSGPGGGYFVAMMSLVGLFVWALQSWAGASLACDRLRGEVETLRSEVSAYRAKTGNLPERKRLNRLTPLLRQKRLRGTLSRLRY